MDYKNIVIGSNKSNFVSLYIDVLVNKCKIEKSSFLIAYTEKMHQPELDGIKAYYYKDIDPDKIKNCNTITSISLNKENSGAIRHLMNIANDWNNFYLHLTDDEIDRWIKTYKAKGKLIPTDSNNFDISCKEILENVINIIAPNAYFKKHLEKLTERNNFNFIDARDPFKSLPGFIWEKFENLYSCNTKETIPEKTICIGAKRGVFNTIDVIKIISNLHKENIVPEYKLILFTYFKKKFHRVAIDIYLGYLRHIKKCNIDIAYPTATNPITYNAIIMSCSHLILQSRGSMSTARSYLSLSRGLIHVKSESPNAIELVESELIKTPVYKNYRELAKNIKNYEARPYENMQTMKIRFTAKYNTLNTIYR